MYEHVLNGNSLWLIKFCVNKFWHVVLAEFFLAAKITQTCKVANPVALDSHFVCFTLSFMKDL